MPRPTRALAWLRGMHAAEALDVGTRVLARREPDLEPEEGVVKKVHSRADGCTAFHVRLVSGRDAEGAAVMGRSVESAVVDAACWDQPACSPMAP